MAHYWVTYAGTGRTASGTGKLVPIRALAQLISMRGVGRGRKTCVVQRTARGGDQVKECYKNGRRAEKPRSARRPR